VPGPVNVKVALLIDVEFIATLKAAVMIVLGQTLAAPATGATEITVGGIKPGLVPWLAPVLQHPGLKMSSRNAANQIL
jgi:hypothetical protein